MTASIRVGIADDQELVRTGLRAIMSAEPDIEVVGEASDGVEAVHLARQCQPDVLLMDIRMPNLDGIEATRRIVSPPEHPRVVILTTFDRSQLVYEALLAGATGFLLKDVPREQLIGGVRAAARGEELLAPRITRRLIAEFTGTRLAPPAGVDRLTDREREIWLLMARGKSNAEIAAELHVSIETVKTHVARVLAKLELRDRVQAVVAAYESGIIRPGEED